MAVAPLRRKFLSPTLKDIEAPLAWSKGIRTPFALMRKPLFGDGYLAGESPGGTTTVEGVPTAATVRVVARPVAGSKADGMVVAEVQSSAAGTWLVEGLNPLLRYDVIGRLAGKDDVIVSDVIPKVDTGIVTYEDKILSYLPLGYWRLGETSGTTAADSSDYGRDGTYTGTFTLGRPSLIPSDEDNFALGCGSGTGYVSVPAGDAIPVSGKTLVFAFKMTSLSTFSYLVGIGDYTIIGRRGVSPYINTNGTISIEFYDGNFRHIHFPGFAATVGVTYRIALRFNTSQSVSLFVNGTLISTQTTTYNMNAEPGQKVRIGAAYNTAFPSPSQGVLKGDIDEFAILPSLLTDEQTFELETIASSI